jgi:TP901 family phage tail tape measure protein
MALSAGNAYVDILPRQAAGFNGAMQGVLSNPLKKAGLVAGGVAVAGVAAGVAGAVKSVNAFASLETGLNEVFTLLPEASGEARAQMTEDVKAFAKDFGVLPDEVVPALYQALSAGVPPDNVFDFLGTAQKAALGGVTDLETAVDGVSSVVNAYGSDIINATEASDLMFTAVRLGKTNFEELSSSLFNVTPTASALGVQFEDVTAALAAMTAQGVPTSVATTQLRQLMVELSKDGSKAADAFIDIAGKPFQQFIAEGGNVAGALEIMQEAAGENEVALQDMFGSVEAGSAALSLTGSDAFTDALEEMGASAGATDKAFETMDQGLSRTWDKIKATFEVAFVDIGQKLAPFVQKFADFFAEALPGIIDGATALFGPLIDILGEVFGVFGDLFGGISEGASEAQGVLQPFIDYITTVFGFVKGVVTDVFNAIRDVFERNSERIGGALQTLGQIFGQIFEVAKTIFGALQAFWDQWGDTILTIFGAVFDNVVVVLSAAFDIIKGIFDVVLGILTGDWSRAWEGIKGIFEGVWNAIKGLIQNAADFLINIWHSLFGNGIVVDTIKGGLDRILGFFAELPGKILGFLAGLPGKLVSFGADLVSGIVSGMGNIVSAVGSKIKSGISSAISGVKSFFGIGSPSKVFAAEIGLPLLQGITSPFDTDGSKAIAGAVTSTVTAGADAGATAAARTLATMDGIRQPIVASGSIIGAAPAGAAGAGWNFEPGAIVIHEAVPEPASVTLPRELKRLAFQNSRG